MGRPFFPRINGDKPFITHLSAMEDCVVRLCWLDPEKQKDLSIPAYKTEGASGLDVEAAVVDSLVLKPGERALIPTGFSVALPEGCELQVRPRSGLAVRHGVTIVNSPGTIDRDYRGEVKIGLINLGDKPYTVQRGDRIAQLVLAPVLKANLKAVLNLEDTERGAGGFGHTGR